MIAMNTILNSCAKSGDASAAKRWLAKFEQFDLQFIDSHANTIAPTNAIADCSDQNVERVKEIGQTISKLIDDEKKENVPFLTSTLIAYLKSMEDILKKEKILQDSLNQKLFYESRIQELQNENQNLKSDIEQIFQKLNHQLSIE